MTSARAPVPWALAAVLLLGACAEPGTGAPGTSPTPGPPAEDGAVVLQVEHVGGFVTPEVLAARLPLVSVYADGRVITEGPVPAIYPGPALPNVQVQRIDAADVEHLVQRALEAGVAETSDLGRPPIADAVTTRFTVATDEATHVREVYALHEVPPRAPSRAPDDPLPEQQHADRERLATFLRDLTPVPFPGTEVEPYDPEVLAVLARPWTDPQDGLQHPDVAWPGPPLPGEPLGTLPEQTCLTVTGDEVPRVLAAAREGNAATPWVGAGGTRWSLTFRPLLPSEDDCADLLPE